MKRRDFLKASALASTSLMVPSFLPAAFGRQVKGSRSGKILVVVQLSGGNDGLNTIIPYRDDIYYRSRPTLAIPKQEVLLVSNELGFNPALEALQPLYSDGVLSMVNSVGYPNPDRSHFRSMDIWHTASDSDQYLSTGWLGRYLDSECSECALPYHALELDDSLILAFSEFGRRVSQNASNGTDHGAANNVFLLSGKLKKPGFCNPGPNLLDLDEGDLKHQVDFRSLYAAILENWLEVEAPGKILGGAFGALGVV